MGAEGSEFARFMSAFLPIARKAPFNYIEVIGMVVAPTVALFGLGTGAGTPFVLTAIGLGLTVAGPLLVSSRLAEPNYDVMLAWDPDAMPTRWEASAILRPELDPGGGNVERVRIVPRRTGGNALTPGSGFMLEPPEKEGKMDQDNIGDRDFKYAFSVMLALVALAILLVLIG